MQESRPMHMKNREEIRTQPTSCRGLSPTLTFHCLLGGSPEHNRATANYVGHITREEINVTDLENRKRFPSAYI